MTASVSIEISRSAFRTIRDRGVEGLPEQIARGIETHQLKLIRVCRQGETVCLTFTREERRTTYHRFV